MGGCVCACVSPVRFQSVYRVTLVVVLFGKFTAPLRCVSARVCRQIMVKEAKAAAAVCICVYVYMCAWSGESVMYAVLLM